MIFFLEWKFSLYLPALGRKQTWASPTSRIAATEHFVCSSVSIYLLFFMVWVRERTIPNERKPLVDEVIANFCG
jgi:hypothetical protein